MSLALNYWTVFFSVSVDSPLYIRPHSKTVLTLAITNDTSFLSSNLVMDYSLLVGLDEHRKELVIGIIGQLNAADKRKSRSHENTLNLIVAFSFSFNAKTFSPKIPQCHPAFAVTGALTS